MFSKIIICLALLTLVAAGKRKGKGEVKGEDTSKKCKKIIRKFEKYCVKKGYASQIQENCVSSRKKMNGKKATKKCAANERNAVKCGYQCTVDGGWGDFGEWSDCSAECGGGTQSRSRSCNNPLPVSGGAKCKGDPSESKDCNVSPCPVDGGWGDFGEWSDCSAECDGGTQSRSRSCNNPLPVSGGAECEGDPSESKDCNVSPCPDSDCSDTTLQNDYRGTKATTVSGYPCQSWSAQSPHKHDSTPAKYPGAGLGDHNYCRNPDNEPKGAWCYTTDPARRWEFCGIPRCDGAGVDGGWGDFGEWSDCSAECDGGTQSRSRSCNNPLPVSGGAECKGDPSESKDCNVSPCPDEWLTVVRDVEFEHDLDAAALEIKTNSELGSDEVLNLWLREENGGSTGGLTINFESPPTYWIHNCQEYSFHTFPGTIPADVNKVWTIERTTEGLKCICNGVVVLTFALSDNTCDNEEGDWEDYWKYSTKKIYFSSKWDTASDYWRSRPDGWLTVVHDVEFEHDLDAAALQIKTNSELGSDEVLNLWFRKEDGYSSGGLTINFESPPTYWIHNCQEDYHTFPGTIPADVNKVWTIERTTEGLTCICNGEVVLTFALSDNTCDAEEGDWEDYWKYRTTKIYFSSKWDTASDYWRSRPGE